MVTAYIQILILLGTFCLSTCAETTGKDSKGNAILGLNWIDEPNPEWPTTPCKDGKRQSPINFPSELSVYNKVSPFKYISANIPKKAYPLLVVHNDLYKIDLTTAAGFVMAMKNGITYKYDAVNLHLHYKSENTWGGVQTEAELHMVFNKSLTYLTEQGVNEDPDKENQYLAMGLGIVGNATTANANWDKMNILTGGPTAETFDLNEFIPLTQPFYFYLGGLTSPGCIEVINWTVQTKHLSISPTQMAQIKTWLQGDIRQNSRGIQPLNGRILYYQDYSAGSFLKLSLLMLVALAAVFA